MKNESFEQESDQVRFRFEKLQKIISEGKIPYPSGKLPSIGCGVLKENHVESSREDLEAKQVCAVLCGRLMARRDFGKAAFGELQDQSGRIQVFFQKNTLGDLGFEEFKGLDIGDFLRVEGYLFRTKTGEISLHVQNFELISKSLRPLPEKFHGLQDIETKYRQRYLDLMTSAETREVFIRRTKIIQAIRDFLVQRDFLEVETPMMHPLVTGAAAKPFETFHNALDRKLYLRIAPELYLKRLVVGGFDKVFEINRNFRNEGLSIKHNPEFTMLEFYWAFATYEDLIRLTQELFQFVARKALGTLECSYQGHRIQFAGEWQRISVEESILHYSGFKNRNELRQHSALLHYIQAQGYDVKPTQTTGELQMVIFDHEVEKNLIQPTFVTDYPMDVSPLSRKSDRDDFTVDRFELFIAGREIANAFSELNDPLDQKQRFLDQLKKKENGDPEATDYDEDYIRALEYGLPPTAGQGIGIDRLVMLLTDSPSIRDVILFPQMRSQ